MIFIIFLILLANAETISIPHRIRSKTEPATEESESDDGDDNEDADDVKESMKAILDNLQKEMSDAVDSASESIEKSEISSAKEQDANKKTKRKSIGLMWSNYTVLRIVTNRRTGIKRPASEVRYSPFETFVESLR